MGLNRKQKPRFLILVIHLMLEVNSALVTFTEDCFVNPERLYSHLYRKIKTIEPPIHSSSEGSSWEALSFNPRSLVALAP